jgi:hypothetical protein
LWAADHRSEIEAWRDTLAQNERDKMNHPTTLRRKYEATHKVVAVDPNAPKKETSREALIRENEEQSDLGQGHRQDRGREHVARQADAAANGDRQADLRAQSQGQGAVRFPLKRRPRPCARRSEFRITRRRNEKAAPG